MNDPTVTIKGDIGHTVAGVTRTWGPFNLLEKVGIGAFGEVYRAFDTTLEREVALKLLLPRDLDQDSEYKTLLREARAIARVRHSNVVPVYGVDRHEGRVGFWSDFVHGKTFSAIVAKDGPFGATEAALIGIDLCKAISAVHAAGLLHRDIKTGNVMREDGGRILLMDFGLTHAYGENQPLSGTPVYMAPELFSGQPATIATDIYALGILLFHLLTGKYPVDGSSLQAIKSAHESAARRSLLEVRPDLPEPLARVIEIAANPDPQKRYGSAGQMITALSGAVDLGPATVKTPEQPKASRLRRLILVATFSALAIAFAIPQFRNAVLPGKANLAPILEVQGDYEKAHDLVEHYYRPQALETAIPLLEKAVQKDLRFAPAFVDLGRANLLLLEQLRDTKYIEPARQASLHALNLNSGLASAHVTLGVLYTRMAKYDLAAQELDEALKLDKYNAAGIAALGGLFDSQGRNDEAEGSLQKAVTLAPNDWRIISSLAEHYLDAGKFAQAGEQYQKAVDLVPDNPRAHNNQGLVYGQQGRLAEGKAAFEKALALEPTFIRFRNLGEVLLEKGDYAEAKRMFERAISLKPDNYRAWGFLATVYRIEGGQGAKAEETYRRAISLADELKNQTPGPYLIADVAGYYAALGMDRQSVPLLRQAAALAPDMPAVLYEVATGYEMLHKRDEALLWIDRAVASGFSIHHLEAIAQLSALRADPRYRAIVNKAR